MLVVPVVVGAVVGGPSWRHGLLLVAWLVAFLAFNAAGLWLRSACKARYRSPVVAYGVAVTVLGGVLVAVEPALLRWAPAYAVTLVVSLVLSWRRADRSWTNDAVTVVAATLMTVVAAGTGSRGSGGHARAVLGVPPGADDPRAWLAAALLTAYFLGTVPYVKSLIRERGRPGVVIASVALHAALVAAALAVVAGGLVQGSAALVRGGALCAVVAVGLLVRAWLVPHRRPWPSAKAIGLGEMGATVVVTACVLAVV